MVIIVFQLPTHQGEKVKIIPGIFYGILILFSHSFHLFSKGIHRLVQFIKALIPLGNGLLKIGEGLIPDRT